jgi:hypothetical protein
MLALTVALWACATAVASAQPVGNTTLVPRTIIFTAGILRGEADASFGAVAVRTSTAAGEGRGSGSTRRFVPLGPADGAWGNVLPVGAA